MRAPFEKFGARDYWVDAMASEAVSTQGTGPGTAALLRQAGASDFAELPASVWPDPHPLPRAEPVISALADYDPADFAQVPPSTWGVARAKQAPAVIDDSDFAPLTPTSWS